MREAALVPVGCRRGALCQRLLRVAPLLQSCWVVRYSVAWCLLKCTTGVGSEPASDPPVGHAQHGARQEPPAFVACNARPELGAHFGSTSVCCVASRSRGALVAGWLSWLSC